VDISNGKLYQLPLVARKDVILVIYDKLSKMAHFVSKTKRTLAEVLESGGYNFLRETESKKSEY